MTDELALIQERAAHGSSDCPNDEAWQQAQRDRRWLLTDHKRLVDFTWGQQARLAEMEKVVVACHQEIYSRDARLAECEAECLEQAILNGKGSEREARLLARLAEALRLLRRYRTETPLGHQPHMIAHEADAVLRTADSADAAPTWDRECVKCGCKWMHRVGPNCPRCEGNALTVAAVQGKP